MGKTIPVGWLGPRLACTSESRRVLTKQPPATSVSDSVNLGWASEFAFLVWPQVMLIPGPHFENHSVSLKWDDCDVLEKVEERQRVSEQMNEIPI